MYSTQTLARTEKAPVYRFEPATAERQKKPADHSDFVRQIVESAERDRLRYEQEKRNA